MVLLECRLCGTWEVLLEDLRKHLKQEHGLKKGDKFSYLRKPYTGQIQDQLKFGVI